MFIILFPLIALTNKVSFANHLLFEFELPKYFYGLMSLVRASGRLFWPVYYLFFLGSIIIIYNKFSGKKSLYILLLLFLFQLIDNLSNRRRWPSLTRLRARTNLTLDQGIRL